MLMNYLFPLAFFFAVGLFMTRINPLFTEIMVPGMILFAVMSSTLLSLPGTMVTNREAGIFRSFRVNGVPAGSLIIIPMIGCLFHTVLASGLITVASPLLYGGRLPVNWGWFVIVFFLVSLSLNSLGVLIGIVSRSSRAAILLAQAFYIPSVLLGGLMVPESMIPDSLKIVASLFPATHGIRAFSTFAFSETPLTFNASIPLLVLFASFIINTALCFLLFQWDTKPASTKRLIPAVFALAPFAAGMLVYAAVQGL